MTEIACKENYLITESQLAPYMIYPKFLLGIDISETGKLIYMLLLNRARLSMKSEEWIDEVGHVFVSYPISSLAEDLGKSETTIKAGLKDLESKSLIVRKRQGAGKASRIFLKVPSVTDRNSSLLQTEIRPTDGQKTVFITDGKLPPNKNNIYKTNNKRASRGGRDNLHYQGRSYECEESESL